MKIFKRSLLILGLTWLLLFVNNASWLRSPIDFVEFWPFYVVPFVIVLAGLILGWFGTMIIQYSRWIRSFYLAGLNASLILLAVVLLSFHISAWWQYWYAYAHPSSRYSFYNYWNLKSESVAAGFDKFYRTLPHPHLVRYLGCVQNSRAIPDQLGSDTCYTVYYCYHLYPDPHTIFFAKVDIRDNQFSVLATNRPATSDSTCSRLMREEIDETNQSINTLISVLAAKKDTTAVDSMVMNGLRHMLNRKNPWE